MLESIFNITNQRRGLEVRALDCHADDSDAALAMHIFLHEVNLNI